jgi:hypothetical protein
MMVRQIRLLADPLDRARWLASSPYHTRERYLGIQGPAEKEGPVRACVAALPRWSGWVYAQQTLWLDPGPDWDEEKVAPR